MSNYIENKSKLDKIRQKYDCKGEILFRTALQYVVECGQQSFQDEDWFKTMLNEIDSRHEIAKAEGKHLFVTRDFEVAIIDCAKEIAKVNTYDLLIYVQKEVWLSGDGMDYQRTIRLLKSALEYLENYNNCNNEENYEAFCGIGLNDDEIEELGFGYLIEEEE